MSHDLVSLLQNSQGKCHSYCWILFRFIFYAQWWILFSLLTRYARPSHTQNTFWSSFIFPPLNLLFEFILRIVYFISVQITQFKATTCHHSLQLDFLLLIIILKVWLGVFESLVIQGSNFYSHSPLWTLLLLIFEILLLWIAWIAALLTTAIWTTTAFLHILLFSYFNNSWFPCTHAIFGFHSHAMQVLL